ncbi:hypothetical protein EDB83DRAFT_2320165 [Lactarius deliciosus]|nr:hypothetical protein EDB83DRAFT_2320165 [Lactarius deliciosus]
MDPFTCRQSIHGLTGLKRLKASTAGLASIIKKGGSKSDMGPLACFRRRQTNAGGLVIRPELSSRTIPDPSYAAWRWGRRKLKQNCVDALKFACSFQNIPVWGSGFLGASSKKSLGNSQAPKLSAGGRGDWSGSWKGCTITALHAWPNALCTSEGKTKLLYVVVVHCTILAVSTPSKVPDKTQSPKRVNHPLSSALPVPRASETKSLNGYGSVSFHPPVPMMYDRRWNGGAHLAWSVCHFSL